MESLPTEIDFQLFELWQNVLVFFEDEKSGLSESFGSWNLDSLSSPLYCDGVVHHFAHVQSRMRAMSLFKNSVTSI